MSRYARQAALWGPIMVAGLVTVAVLTPTYLSRSTVDILRNRFQARDPLLVQVTVDEMIRSGDPRFVPMAVEFLEQSRSIRATPPLPRDVEARLQGAVRILAECDPTTAERLVLSKASSSPRPWYHHDRWALLLADKLSSPRAKEAMRGFERESPRAAQSGEVDPLVTLVAGGDVAAIGTLYQMICDPGDPGSARGIIQELKQAGTPACRELLWRHVRERKTTDWSLSALALLELGDPDAKAVLAQALTADPASVEPLFHSPYFQRLLTPEGIDVLLLLASRDHDNRWVIVDRCRNLLREQVHPQVRQAIHSGMSSPDPHIREICARWLADIDRTLSVDPLLQAFENPDPAVRRGAVASLTALPDERVKARLRQALAGDPDAVVRRTLAGAFGEWKDPSLVPDLQAALDDDDSFVRRHATGSLVQIQGDGARETVLLMLADRSAGVRLVAMQCATDLKLKSAADLALPLLKDSQELVRRAAVRFFVAVPDERSVPGIIAVLDQQGVAERWEALEALTQLRATAAADRVLKMIEAPPDQVTARAAAYFARCPDPRCVPPLLDLLQGQNLYGVHQQVINALGQQQDDRAVEPLAAILKTSKDILPPTYAARALMDINSPKARAALEEARQTDRHAVHAAIGEAEKSAKQQE